MKEGREHVTVLGSWFAKVQLLSYTHLFSIVLFFWLLVTLIYENDVCELIYLKPTLLIRFSKVVTKKLSPLLVTNLLSLFFQIEMCTRLHLLVIKKNTQILKQLYSVQTWFFQLSHHRTHLWFRRCLYLLFPATKAIPEKLLGVSALPLTLSFGT